jgi:putative FmdB family regulatory protein
MPLFDFECRSCGKVFEAILKMTETPDDLCCPACERKNPRKLISRIQTNLWSSFLDDMEKRVNPHKFK